MARRVLPRLLALSYLLHRGASSAAAAGTWSEIGPQDGTGLGLLGAPGALGTVYAFAVDGFIYRTTERRGFLDCLGKVLRHLYENGVELAAADTSGGYSARPGAIEQREVQRRGAVLNWHQSSARLRQTFPLGRGQFVA